MRRPNTSQRRKRSEVNSPKRAIDRASRSKRKGREEKAILAALIESEQRLRAIVETVVDAIVTIDDRGVIKSANSACARLFGHSLDQVIGNNVKMLMPEPFYGQHDGHIRRYLKTGQARVIGVGREVTGRHKNGARFPIHLSISEMRLSGRRMFTAVIHDLTQRRRLEREVLEASSTTQRQIGRELHDGLCQNLIGVGLRMNVLAKQLHRAHPAAAAEAEQLGKFIRQIAAHARELSHGLVPREISEGKLQEALKELSAHITKLFSVECQFRCLSSISSYDTIRSTHLYRIAQEAATNAIRHGGADRIGIAITEYAGTTTLTVRDNGRGFARKPGKGLGIQTMTYRARVIGGVLRIVPAPNGGTEVRCSFPTHQTGMVQT